MTRWIGTSDASTSKKQRLSGLIRTLRDGPATIAEHPELKEDYSLWLESWVIPEMQKLFPQWKIKPKEERSQ